MTVEPITQFPGTSSPEQANLDAILNSPTYRIAHEDPDLLNSNAMRGVRMLLEITKPAVSYTHLTLPTICSV